MPDLLEYLAHRVPMGNRNPVWLEQKKDKQYVRQNHYGDWLVFNDDGLEMWLVHPGNREHDDDVWTWAEIRMNNPNGESYLVKVEFSRDGGIIL